MLGGQRVEEWPLMAAKREIFTSICTRGGLDELCSHKNNIHCPDLLRLTPIWADIPRLSKVAIRAKWGVFEVPRLEQEARETTERNKPRHVASRCCVAFMRAIYHAHMGMQVLLFLEGSAVEYRCFLRSFLPEVRQSEGIGAFGPGLRRRRYLGLRQ